MSIIRTPPSPLASPRVSLIGPPTEVRDAMRLLLEGRRCRVDMFDDIAQFVEAPGRWASDLAFVDLYPMAPGRAQEVETLRNALGPRPGLIVTLTPDVSERTYEALAEAGSNACLPMSSLPDRVDAIIAWAAAASRTANAPAPPHRPRGEADR